MTTLNHNSAIESEHPLSEGVFESEHPNPTLFPLPDFSDIEVEASYRIPITSSRHDAGTTWVEEWRMTDGTKRQILHGEPKSPVTDIAVIKNTALGTQVRGFNEDVAHLIMSKGFPVEIIGPEINSSLSITRSAHDTHKILDITEQRGYHAPGVISQEGYSRGSMIGFGVLALASKHDREIVYSNLTDPCFEHQPSIQDISRPSRILNLCGNELATAVIQLGKLTLNPSKAWNYRRTIDFSGQGLRQLYRTGLPLFTGESGILARHAAMTNPRLLIGFFGRSLTNHMREYEQIFKGCDNVVIKHSDGGHLRGMDKHIMGHIATKFSLLGEQLRDGALPKDLDFTNILRRNS